MPETNRVKTRLPKICEPPSPTNPAMQRVWIVFGTSSQIGGSLVQRCLEADDFVVAVNHTTVEDYESSQKWKNSQNCIRTFCDMRCRDSIESVIDLALSHFKHFDIVVNCVEYGIIGSCEDQDEYELRNQFEINFMGTLHIIQVSSVFFRKQGSGRFLIFNTTPGALGMPGLGPFCATKCAVEGLLESILYELDHFNIKVTLVECGWIGKDSPDLETKKSVSSYSGLSSTSTWGHFILKSPSEPYSCPTSPALHALKMIQWLADKPLVCIQKCAELAWQLGHCNYPPLRLTLGRFAIESLRDRMRSLIEELEDWTYLHFPITSGGSISDESEERIEMEGSS